MEHAATANGYRVYWQAWFFLLAVTLTMVLLTHPVVLVGGILIKASVIGLWFMHLRYEKADLGITVALGLLLVGLILFGLILPDVNGVRG